MRKVYSEKHLIKNYKKMYALDTDRKYGHGAQNYNKWIFPIIKEVQPITIIDYGCGITHWLDVLLLYPNIFTFINTAKEYKEIIRKKKWAVAERIVSE